jgi:hypothetical protein
MVLVLGVAALLYPATLALRLTAAGTETSNRASEFVFVGLGVVAGLAFLRWIARRTDAGRRGPLLRAPIAAGLGALFIGGLIVGWAPYARLPAGYLVAAGSRSIEPEGVEAARWAGRHLPDHSRMLADSTNELLMAAFGDQNVISGQVDGRRIGAVLTARRLRDSRREIVAGEKLRYVVVDLRLSEALPRTGRYFSSGDPTPNQYTEPIPRQALTKFDDQPDMDAVFRSGNITIYDTSRVRDVR